MGSLQPGVALLLSHTLTAYRKPIYSLLDDFFDGTSVYDGAIMESGISPGQWGPYETVTFTSLPVYAYLMLSYWS